MLFVNWEVLRSDLQFLEGETGCRAGGGKHDFANAGMDGGFEDIDGADHVYVEQLRRRRPARSRYGREMDDGVLALAGFGKLGGLHNVALDEACPFHTRRGAAEASDGVARLEKLSQYISADGAAASCYEDLQHLMSPMQSKDL